MTSLPLSPPKATQTALAFWIHAQFVLIGVTTVLLGPLLPAIAAHWSLTDLQSGYFFSAQFAGNMLGSILSTWLLPRWGFARLCAAGMALLCSGLGIFGLASWHVGLVGVFFNGLGMGLAIAASNLWAAESNPTRRTSAISLLNFSWGAGAVACPFLIVAGLRLLPMTRLLPLLGIFPLLLAIRFAKIPAPAGAGDSADLESTISRHEYRTLSYALIAILCFLYVGTEVSLSGWIASYARAFSSVSAGGAALAPSAFLAGLLFGRGVAPQVFRFHREHTIFTLGLLMAFLGSLLVLTTHLIPFLLVGAAIAGLGLSALYPILLAVMSRELGAQSKRRGGFIFACSGVGGATIPFLVGAISSHTGNRRTGLAVVLATIAALLTISLSFSKYLAFSARETS